jgi:hypothetical protein|tara:strand:+ start:30 stop:191 length:162 start_codon:yes stop_codon:yes gene_type:complete
MTHGKTYEKGVSVSTKKQSEGNDKLKTSRLNSGGDHYWKGKRSKAKMLKGMKY